MNQRTPTLPQFPGDIAPVPAPAPLRSEQPWTVRRTSRPVSRPVKPRLTRRFEIEWLEDDNAVLDEIHVAPALPIFEKAFGAFTHGVLIHTTDGPVAVEDLVPGMHLCLLYTSPSPRDS